MENVSAAVIGSNRLLKKLYKRQGIATLQQDLQEKRIEVKSALDRITLDLPGAKLTFDPEAHGTWSVGEAKATGPSKKEVEKLQRKLEAVGAERNALEFKLQLVIDMLTLTSLDLSSSEKDLEDAEREIKKLQEEVETLRAGGKE